MNSLVPSAGIEPAFQAPEACVLSIELRGPDEILVHGVPGRNRTHIYGSEDRRSIR